MPFQVPITIKEVIDNVHSKKYLLPAIQRELVWKTDQIELLFDSLMRDFPVGSFLFWFVNKHRSQEYQFYEFLRNYHERDTSHNPKAHVTGEDNIIAVLDGQQRLTSLYIGLRGSYAYKEPHKRWENDSAFPTRTLHLNLLQDYKENEIVDKKYDFAFLTEKEVRERSDIDHYWFRVSDILLFKEHADVNDYLLEKGLLDHGEKSKFANRTLFKLHAIIHQAPVINYFLEKDESLDKVLNIFVRVNSAGTPLDYSDLLLSIASAQWQEKDAREEIVSFVEEIKSEGDGFTFDKDFVLKSCLVLCEFTNIAFKVDNFNKVNMLRIEEKWDRITDAIRLTVNLVASYGYSRDTLTSNNALIPIAYYLFKKGSPRNFTLSSHYTNDRSLIQKWLILALLKKAFSGQPDTVLRPIRAILDEHHEVFPLYRIIEEFRGKPKSLIFGDDDIEALFDQQYGNAYTFSTLAMLYPNLDFRNKFHVDHIFPKSQFTRSRLIKYRISEELIENYLEEFNRLANLQLIEGIPNMEKSSTDFKEWLFKTYSNEHARRDYMQRHYIPDVDLNLENFDEFIQERKKLISSKFAELLKP